MVKLQFNQTSILQIMIVILIISILSFLPNKTDAANVTVERIKGTSRYDTAVMVSKEGWVNGSDKVVLAVGTNFPDALAGTPLAYSLNAPILLTDKNSLPVSTKKEIERLKAKEVILLGGSTAITEDVEKQLLELNVQITRIQGKNRYETASNIAKYMNPDTDTAIVVYGGNFPDSLSIASYAAQKGYPILLTTRNELHEATNEVVTQFKHTIVVGGQTAVSNQVLNELNNPTRISGQNRYDTSATVVEDLNLTINEAYLATGNNFADALAGSVLAAKRDSTILLVKQNNLPKEIENVIGNVKNFSIIGGTGAVSDDVIRQLTFDVNGLVSTAKSLRGVRYRWGGTTPNGFDCSGFLNYVFDKYGIDLPRTTKEIWKYGKTVNKPEVGDIVFFKNTYRGANGISHAGIYIGDGKFIHASSSRGVTIDSIETGYWSSNSLYAGVKRVF